MPDLAVMYAELKAIMQPYAFRLDTKTDSENELYVDTWYIQKNKKPLFEELALLTKSGFESYKERGFV